MADSAGLKAEARGLLAGNYRGMIFIHVLYVALISVIQELAARTGIGTAARIVLFVFISLLVSTVSGVLYFGLIRSYMNMSCAFEYSPADLFYGFRNDSLRVSILAALVALMQTICILPGTILLSYYYSTGGAVYFLVGTIYWSIGLPIYFWLFLNISQGFYLLLDFPDKSIQEIWNMAFWLMKGYKLKLFYLYMSFIPMLLLGILSMGVGLIWVLPYIQATLTQFYLNRVRLITDGE